MKIKIITSQSRRDFYATMECEHCNHIEEKVPGYDDANFHNNVIPNMECKSCGEKSPESFRPIAPKYGEHEVI